MPICYKCHYVISPDFCNPVQPGNLSICHFCQQGKDNIFAGDIMYNKLEVSHDYKIFLKKLAESGNIKDSVTKITVEAAVKGMKQ